MLSSPRQKVWDEYFINIASTVATKSKDPSTKVGAVLVRPKSNALISTGYNGFPSRIVDDEAVMSTRVPSLKVPITKYDIVIHAEMNAILHALCDLDGATLYCTHQPCNDCLKHIIAVGIARVVYANPYTRADDVRAEIVRTNLVGASRILFEEYNPSV